jgi:hypothetical protein
MGKLYSVRSYHSVTPVVDTIPVIWEITVQLDAKLIANLIIILGLIPLAVSVGCSLSFEYSFLQMFPMIWAVALITALLFLRPVSFVVRKKSRMD